jgi:hypothetical protein
MNRKMETANGAAPAQAAAAAQPQEGTGAPQEGAPRTGGTQITDLAALQRELTEARQEAAKHRTELNRYKEAETAATEAAKSELQKAIDRAEAAEKARDEGLSQVKTYQLRLATVEAARQIGFRNPEIAHRLVSASDVEYAADGTPKNINQLLAKIAESDPYLVTGMTGKASDLGGGPRGAPAGSDVNAMIRRAAGRH